MTGTTVKECPVCGDRKLVDHKQHLPPTIWCSHTNSEDDNMEPFVKMETVEDEEE